METQRMRAQGMDPRVNGEVIRALLAPGAALAHSGLERRLLDLMSLRASQINGCAFCIDMHWKDLRAEGEDDDRLYMLDAWDESSLYSERERAALLWTEAVTRLGEARVPDEVYEQVRRSYSDDEMLYLTLAVIAINGWNRLNVALRTVPGTYQPARRPTEAVAAD